MANRIFYACQNVAIAKSGFSSASTPEFAVMPGVQSVGISTNITLEQIFELGQLDLYANEENLAEVEVTLEKVIDGEKLLYLQCVGENGKSNIVSASNSKCDVYLAVYNDTVTSVSGASTTNVAMCSGMFISSVSYNYSVNGNATESVSLVGNNKFWNSVTAGILGSTPTTLYGTGGNNMLNGSDVPASSVVRRGRFNLLGSTLPSEVVSQVATVAGASGIQSISVSCDFGRTDQLELGRFGPYNKTANFPIQVSSNFEVTMTQGDLVSVSGFGVNTTNRAIILKDNAGTVINLGTKNRLTSVAQNGGDTGGGNATVTYSYTNYNNMTVDGGGTYWT